MALTFELLLVPFECKWSIIRPAFSVWSALRKNYLLPKRQSFSSLKKFSCAQSEKLRSCTIFQHLALAVKTFWASLNFAPLLRSFQCLNLLEHKVFLPTDRLLLLLWALFPLFVKNYFCYRKKLIVIRFKGIFLSKDQKIWFHYKR